MAGGAAVQSGNGEGFSHLIDRSRPWWKNSRLLALNGWIVLLVITATTNGYDGSMMNGLQALKQWEDYFQNPTKGRLGLLNAIQNIGSLAAYPFSPYLTDGIGRRGTILFGASIMIIAAALQGAAQSVGMFIGARFLIGFGLTFSTIASPLLVTEIAYPSQRAQLTSMYNTLWYLGSIIAAWTTFGTFHLQNSWSWRIPSILQGLASMIQICLIWFAPESPRWLASKGREKEALRTLAYYHARGNEQDPLVEYEFQEITASIRYDREVAANVGWLALFKTPGNRKRMRVIITLAFFSQWSGNGLISYYLTQIMTAIGITNRTDQLLINGCLNIWNFGVAIGAGYLCERLGRRLLFMASCIGMVVFWTLQTVCFALYSLHGNKYAANTFIAMIFLFYASYDLAFTPLIVSYTVEILPTPLRAKGFTIFNFTISLALIFNQYVNPIAFAGIGWKYYLVYVCWLMFETVFIYFYIVETRHRSLEETAALFDGEDNVEHILHGATARVGIDKEVDEKSGHEIIVDSPFPKEE